MNTKNNIDDLFREAMTGYRVQPSFGLWRRIERRFFPPSKFRPSGLITSIFLLVLAGLMPWILIPANDQNQMEPNIISENIRQGYLIQAASPEELTFDKNTTVKLSGRSFTIKPTVYLGSPVDPAGDPSTQLIASINDPFNDPSLQPIISALKKNYKLNIIQPSVPISNFSDPWNYRMDSRPANLMESIPVTNEIINSDKKIPLTSFSPDYENDYVRKAEISAGLNFNPSIVFYNPNPYNKMIGADAIIHFKIASFSIMTGLGFSRMEDIGKYKVNYMTNDSVGFYLRVVSFIPDPRNPGQITYVVTEEPIYDSVPHYEITDKINYYSYIDIPLAFGYTFFQKSRVSLTATVGVKFSVLVDKNEPTVDFWISEAELVGIESQVPARTTTNWRFTSGIDFGYLFTDKFSLHLEPVFEKYISPIYKKQAGYEARKPYVTGVKAGIRYNF